MRIVAVCNSAFVRWRWWLLRILPLGSVGGGGLRGFPRRYCWSFSLWDFLLGKL